MTTSGVVTQFPVSGLVGQASSITAGPDGSLWIAEWTKNKIGRMTTAGVWTEFSIPTASSGPQTIVAGPDGAMWFTELVGKIGRMTTAGVVTNEYPIPTRVESAAGSHGRTGRRVVVYRDGPQEDWPNDDGRGGDG